MIVINKKFLKNFYEKILNLSIEEVDCGNSATKRVIASMKTTAVSRYHAATRIAWQSKIAFLTTTVLSLGLIFIPLMQLAKVEISFSNDVLSAIQIFLAVAVLVYSVIIGTAKYETRCENLNDCGDKVKDLIRELKREAAGGEAPKEVVEDIQRRYAIIVADVENHQRCDFSLTIIRYRDLYQISILCWLKLRIYIFFILIMNYFPVVILIALELFIITDMFKITSYFAFLH
ncbi:SLATT domain-containing protein [Acinetobacter sp. MYb177]|uniref:SLATT domain-containing protein n=1 Tax=unclassified Acinetobacter TaxID=196816 RepID=UPI00309E6828